MPNAGSGVLETPGEVACKPELSLWPKPLGLRLGLGKDLRLELLAALWGARAAEREGCSSFKSLMRTDLSPMDPVGFLGRDPLKNKTLRLGCSALRDGTQY